MKSLFKAVLVATVFSFVTVTSAWAAPMSYEDVEELELVENMIVPTYNVAEFWYGVNKLGEATSILIESGNAGLGYYREESDGSLSVGFMEILNGDTVELPVDWDIIFYMSDAGIEPSVFAINMGNGNSRVFKPNTFPGE